MSMQVSIIHPDGQLVGIRRIISDHQVSVGIKAGGAAAERLGPVGIRKHIIAVAVAFCYGERRVDGHPENQIGKLAETAAAPRMEAWSA